MKKSNNSNSRIRYMAAVMLPVCIIITASFFAKPFSQSCGKIVLAFAGASMPEGSINMIKSEMSGNTQTRVDSVINQSGITQPKTTQNQNPTSPNIQTPAPYNQLQTPSDIQALIERAKVEQAKAKNSGKIIEKNYANISATYKFQNVFVKNVTDTKTVNIESTLAKQADLKISDKSQPTVLLYHTHTTEAYETLDRGWYSTEFRTRSKNPQTNMVRVGLAIKQRLEAAGFVVLHDTHIHDTSYNGSYGRSRACIDEYKKKYPSLKVIIDVHRDGMQQKDGTKLKPTASISGKKAAQIMIITGCQDGKVTDFPDWEQNLVFALQLQKKVEDSYPGLMRPVFFSPRKYNMDTSHCGVLLEVGSDSNTLEEAVYSGELIGNSLAALMNDYVTS
ncbi:MAG: stage II sporulation protein P [Oscillospiraceae bacterium]